MNKQKRVKIKTPNGDIYLTFKLHDDYNKDNGFISNVCLSCRYHHICDKIEDPRYPNNPDFRFIDLCGDIGDIIKENNGEEDENGISNYLIPVEGTIENNINLFQELIKENPLIKLSNIIDSICPNWCSDYDPEHSKCNSKNNLCIMHDLFKFSEKINKDSESN